MDFGFGLEIWQLLAIGFIFFFSCFLQGVIGFGAGAFGIPILYFVGLDLDTAIAAITIASMTQAGVGAWKLKTSIQWRTTLRPGLIRILFIIPGVLTLQTLMEHGGDSPEQSKQVIQQAIGLILILIVICKACIKVTPQKELHLGWELFAFSISGVMMGFIGMGGPAVAIWVMAQPWNAKQSRGFLFTMLFYGMIPLAFILVWRFGMTSFNGLILGTIALPIVFAGTSIGIYMGNKLDRIKLQRYALLALLLIGLSAIIKPIIMQ